MTNSLESLGACNSSEAGLNYRPSVVPCWQGPVEVEEEDAGLGLVVDRLQRELVRNLMAQLNFCGPSIVAILVYVIYNLT